MCCALPIPLRLVSYQLDRGKILVYLKYHFQNGKTARKQFPETFLQVTAMRVSSIDTSMSMSCGPAPFSVIKRCQSCYSHPTNNVTIQDFELGIWYDLFGMVGLSGAEFGNLNPLKYHPACALELQEKLNRQYTFSRLPNPAGK